MPNTPITMNKLRIIIRLYQDRHGLKAISRMAPASRTTVKKYIQKWHTLDISYGDFLRKSDNELYELFCVSPGSVRVEPRMEELDKLLPGICKELGRKGMTLKIQWEKYKLVHPGGYGMTRFSEAIQRYRMITNPTMRLEHKAGDKMFVDYTGNKLWIYPLGEAPREVEVFVSILGCSLLTYVEAVESQSKEDFITACENAFRYYGGVPQAVVPDNLKAAVSSPGRYESKLNEEFERFAEHYAVVVLPARVRKPRDKSHVENAVKLTYKDIFTHIEPLHCVDLKSLNTAIRDALEAHNNAPLSRRCYSRRSYFEEIEKEALAPLNPTPYQIKRHCMATVGKDGYVRLAEDIHHYSVPHTFIGKKLKMCYTAADVEIFDGYRLVAAHPRSRLEFRHTTNPDHLSPKHKAMFEWTPEAFIRQAAEIHPCVEHYIRKVIEKKRYAEQASKSCAGILALARKVGNGRLVAACRLADSYARYSFHEIQDILKTGSEQVELPEETLRMPEHKNIRGKEYYE